MYSGMIGEGLEIEGLGEGQQWEVKRGNDKRGEFL
jgi:hypothetical protein